MSYTLAANWPGGFWTHWLVFAAIIIGFLMAGAMAFIWLERRGLGRFQARLGPNRAGPFGVLQPVADALKVLLKEDIIPSAADRVMHTLAPIVAFVPVLMVFAVVPFQDGAQLVDLNVGIFYVVAVSSLTVVGLVMAGWGSNNKYSLISAMRVIGQEVSYEIPMVLAVVGVVLVAGSLSLGDIVRAQSIPYILLQPLGFVIFFLAACAEINRSPFDLLEADSEIVAGFFTEYSGMKFALFYLVEYAEALAVSSIIATLFLGGWKGPLLPPWLWFVIKVFAVFFVIFWVRGTIPRVRVDQLMAFAWKGLLPLALINLAVTAVEVVVLPGGLGWPVVLVNLAVMAVLVLLWSKLVRFGGGRVEIQ